MSNSAVRVGIVLMYLLYGCWSCLHNESLIEYCEGENMQFWRLPVKILSLKHLHLHIKYMKCLQIHEKLTSLKLEKFAPKNILAVLFGFKSQTT